MQIVRTHTNLEFGKEYLTYRILTGNYVTFLKSEPKFVIGYAWFQDGRL